MNDLSAKHVLRVIERSIVETGLDLSGLTVLTELGSGPFCLSPLIAVLGGAEAVFAWTRDSRYGSASENEQHFCSVMTAAKIDKNLLDRITVRLNSRPSEDIAAADIITNSGMIRPLDRSFLQYARLGHTVIPLMYDAWELRPVDIDLEFCRRLGLRVCGVNESDDEFPIFEYVRSLALKMALNAGHAVLDETIIVWSDDPFGREIAAAFTDARARMVLLTTNWSEVIELLPEVDFVFLADYDESRCFFTHNDLFPLTVLNDIAPAISFVHLYGDVKPAELLKCGVGVFPTFDGLPQRMSYTLAEVGVTPLVRLTTAGLRSGQELLKDEKRRFAQSLD